MAQALGAGTNPSQTLSLNFKLISHHTLDGFGGVGEGINMQVTKDGRRILWLAHETAPKNFTAVDVTEPRSPLARPERTTSRSTVRRMGSGTRCHMRARNARSATEWSSRSIATKGRR